MRYGNPLFAKLTVSGPAEPSRPVTVAGWYGPRGQFKRATVSVAAGLHSVELDCDGGADYGRVFRFHGFGSPEAARQAGITFAAAIGRAVLAS